MPGKPRKKASTQKAAPKPKKPDKLDQILLRLDRIDEHLSEHDKRFDAVDQRFDGVDQRLDGHDKRFESIDEQLVEMREENRKEHEHDRKMMLKLYDEQSLKTEKLQQDVDEFRDQMLTTMDAIRGEYDTSRQERLFTGAAQDRQQKEIDHLRQSDEEQNEALGNLENRVTQLELNKAA